MSYSENPAMNAALAQSEGIAQVCRDTRLLGRRMRSGHGVWLLPMLPGRRVKLTSICTVRGRLRRLPMARTRLSPRVL
jgi:hypothetical protein